MAAIAVLVLLATGLVASSLRSSDVDLATRCTAADSWSATLNRTDQARDLPALEFRTREYAAVVGSKQLRGDSVGFALDESWSEAETRERVAMWMKAAKRIRAAAPREMRTESDRIVDFAGQLHAVLERYGYVLPLANVPTPVPDDVRAIEVAFGVYFADVLAVDSFAVDVCR